MKRNHVVIHVKGLLRDIRFDLKDKSRPFLNCVDALTPKPSAEPSSCTLYTRVELIYVSPFLLCNISFHGLNSNSLMYFFQVVKREAKYEGLQDNTVTVSLVNWALPYAQRYIFTLHHEKYTQTKKTVHSQVKRLQVFVVDKLCYRNVIPQHGISSNREFKCSALLQVCILSFVTIYPIYFGIVGAVTLCSEAI